MSGESRRNLRNELQRAGLLGGFAEFLNLEIAGSVLLLGVTALALIIANSPAHTMFETLLHIQIGLEAGHWTFVQSLKHWIDGGLMALFFFVIGLEVKREMVVGELSKPRQAMLPVVAALGGMLVPAAVYLVFNVGDGVRGWGIPMATDIAFALGVLTVLGSRAPANLKLFLTALAIADDIGASLEPGVWRSLTAQRGQAGSAGHLDRRWGGGLSVPARHRARYRMSEYRYAT